MIKLWHKISYLGVEYNTNSLQSRAIILKNQINFIMMLVIIFFIIFSTITREINGGKMTIGTLRLDFILATNLIVILLSSLRIHQLGKYLLIFFPTFFLVLFPYFFNFFETESYFFNPLIIIGFSIVTPLIVVPGRNKWAISLFLTYFLLLLIFNKPIILKFAPSDLAIIPVIKTFDLNYTFVPIAAFVFIHLAIYYLRSINKSYERKLISKNDKLQLALNDLKVTQQQLIQSEKMASVGNLTSGVAHEINNPLNIITGGLHILKNNMKNLGFTDEVQKEKVTKSIQMIEEGNMKVNDIVSSLMTFSFRGVSKLQPMKVEDLIEKTLLFLKVKITDNISIERDFQLNEEVPVYPEKLHQVILNILDNAIFVLHSDGKNASKTIQLKTEKIGNYAQIEIFNNGPNIEIEKLNSVFDPFFTTKDPGKGTGLGLSISYSLIDEHKGYLFAENKKEGVSFIIKLPLTQE